MGFSEFDASAYLTNEEEAEAYLDAILEDGNAQEVRLALDTIARVRNEQGRPPRRPQPFAARSSR